MCIVMEQVQVKEFIDTRISNLDSHLWEDTEPYPEDKPLRIDTILTHNHAFERYVISNPDEIRDFQLESVLSMIRCVGNENGGMYYECPCCGRSKFIPFRCHSRCCSVCGKRYAESWGRNLMERFFPVSHRHVIFTLPGPLWEFVLSNMGLYVKDMFEAAVVVIRRLFASKFKHIAVKPGMICIVHFTGRDMKFNPHIHMLVTEGGLNSRGEWKSHSFWPYKKMSEYWKYELLRLFSSHRGLSLDDKSLLDGQRKQRFNNGTNGYVVKNFLGVLDVKNVGSYLARYVRHPPIGESRLLGYDGNVVRIKYEWDNKMHTCDVSLSDFISSILVNIPPKGFQVVRQFGMYSNLCYGDSNRVFVGIVQVQSLLIDFEKRDARNVRCNNCGSSMELLMMEIVRHGRCVFVIY